MVWVVTRGALGYTRLSLFGEKLTIGHLHFPSGLTFLPPHTSVLQVSKPSRHCHSCCCHYSHHGCIEKSFMYHITCPFKWTTQWFLVHSQSWAIISTISLKTFHHPEKNIIPLTRPAPDNSQAPFCLYRFCPSWTFPVNGSIQDVAFCGWFLALGIMSSRFSMLQGFIPFYCRVGCPCRAIPHFIDPFSN